MRVLVEYVYSQGDDYGLIKFALNFNYFVRSEEISTFGHMILYC